MSRKAGRRTAYLAATHLPHVGQVHDDWHVRVHLHAPTTWLLCCGLQDMITGVSFPTACMGLCRSDIQQRCLAEPLACEPLREGCACHIHSMRGMPACTSAPASHHQTRRCPRRPWRRRRRTARLPHRPSRASGPRLAVQPRAAAAPPRPGQSAQPPARSSRTLRTPAVYKYCCPTRAQPLRAHMYCRTNSLRSIKLYLQAGVLRALHQPRVHLP